MTNIKANVKPVIFCLLSKGLNRYRSLSDTTVLLYFNCCSFTVLLEIVKEQ